MTELVERAPILCEAITEAFGERCEDFVPDCWACKAWAELDALTAALTQAPAPMQYRHEECGYVEFLNEEVPTIVREIDGRVAILLELEQPRRVVGYRVYDPDCSPSEVFGAPAPTLTGEVETPAPVTNVDAVVKAADDAICSAVFMEYRDGGAVVNRLLPHEEVRARVEEAIRSALATTEGLP